MVVRIDVSARFAGVGCLRMPLAAALDGLVDPILVTGDDWVAVEIPEEQRKADSHAADESGSKGYERADVWRAGRPSRSWKTSIGLPNGLATLVVKGDRR